jgi:hypothetical protein
LHLVECGAAVSTLENGLFNICHQRVAQTLRLRRFDTKPPTLLVDKNAIGLRLALPSVFVASTKVLRSGARWNVKETPTRGTTKT